MELRFSEGIEEFRWPSLLPEGELALRRESEEDLRNDRTFCWSMKKKGYKS